LLRDLGSDILISTHSTEIITEAEIDDIVLVNKSRQYARRIKDPSQLGEVFNVLGSNINPILTQLAKTRRALFVEGKDFQIIGRFARKLGEAVVGNRRNFAVVPVDGFSPERIRSLKAGIETTLGVKIVTAAILDKDYRCDDECAAIHKDCQTFCNFVSIHNRKEVENFLLVPAAIDRAMAQRVTDRGRRSGTIPSATSVYEPEMDAVLGAFAESRKSYVMSQILAERRRFERVNSPKTDEAQINQLALDAFENLWRDPHTRFDLIPGKKSMAAVNRFAQESYGVSVTATAIIDSMRTDEVPSEMKSLVQLLAEFAVSSPASQVIG
jgi:hypothetical protein